MVDNKPNIDELVVLLKEMEQLLTKDDYKNLCFFLTLNSVQEHPKFHDWSVYKGRINTFEVI